MMHIKNKEIKSKLIALFLVVILGIGVTLSYDYINKKTQVVTINGEAVSQKEFKLFIKKHRSEIENYFSSKYGVQAENKNFWTQSYSGEVPQHLLKVKALEELVSTKIQQIYAKEKGIINNIKYESIIEEMNIENKKRAITQKEGGVIFGPVQYKEEMFYDYVFSNMVLRLKESLLHKEITYDETKLYDFYEKQKEEFYKKPIDANTMLITINYEKPEQKQRAIAIMEELKLEADRGKYLEVLSEQTVAQGMTITTSNLEFNHSYLSEDDIRHSFVDEVQNLNEGKFSTILHWGNTCYMLQVIKRQERGYIPFEEIKYDVMDNYVDQKYIDIISDKVRKAEIAINQKVYDNISVDDLKK